MSLETRIVALATAMGTDVKTIYDTIGVLTNLTTTNKTSIVDAINEVKAQANGSGNASQADIDNSINALRTELLGGAGAAYDTFKELEDLLQADATIVQGLTTAVANRLRFDAAQTLTEPQKLQANENLGIGNHERDFVADYTAAKS